MTRAFVVGRKRKGRHIGRAVDEVQRLLEAAGWKVRSRMVVKKRTLEHSARQAVKAGCDVIVVVGGDGAVVRVASAVAETETALGIIPKGTGNLLAGNLRLPSGLRGATRTILAGHTRRIDLGHLSLDGVECDFAVACGIGFDAEVMGATGAKQKLRWGKLAYLANAVGKVGTIANVAHRITLDGALTETDAAQVFVANFGRMLPFVEPRLSVEPDDGLLDVIIVRASGPLTGLLASWEAMRQSDLGESSGGHVFRARAREVHIEAPSGRLVEADGNAVGRTPVTVTIRPRSLRVLVGSKA